jgi:hypothetical protein
MISYNYLTSHFRFSKLVTVLLVLCVFIGTFLFTNSSSADAQELSTGPAMYSASILTGRSEAFSVARSIVNPTFSRTELCPSCESIRSNFAIKTHNYAGVGNLIDIRATSGGNFIGKGADRSHSYGKQIPLHDLGLLQLAAHDLFNIDREAEVDAENGDLDLSTLLDYGYNNIAIGGEPRNRENIILFTVAKEYGELYIKYLETGKTPLEAKQRLIKKYHRELRMVFIKTFGEKAPNPMVGEVTLTENLALRTIHDFLPGHIMVDSEEYETIDHSLVGKELSKRELRQKSAPLDGEFDEVFLDVVIFIPPSTILHMDLLERDSSFATQFGTDHTFEHFLEELEDGSFDKNEDVMHYIRNLFAKGFYLD